MKPNTRAAIAYIAARLILRKEASAIFDYGQGEYIQIDGTVTAKNIDTFDYDRGCHVGGDGDGRSFSLFHYGDSHHIDLSINGMEFEGFDYGVSCHFSGEVSGDSVSFFDYGEGSYFNYSI